MDISIFNSTIFKSKLYFNEKNKLVEEIKNNYSKCPNQAPKLWKCNVHSSLDTDYQIPIELVKNIENKFNIFMDDHLKKIKIDGNYYIESMWYNAYGKNQFQEPHTHAYCIFAGCYYLKFDKNIHHQTIFYNPNYNLNYSKLEENPYFCFPVDCEEDDIIFFPSYLKHGTKGIKDNTSEELRITISFNISNTLFIKNDMNKKIFYFN